MKKISIVSVIVYPYTIVALTVLLISGFLTTPKYYDVSFVVLIFILVIWFLSLIGSLYICHCGRTEKIPPYEMAKTNMLIKLIHIPAYISIFVFSLISFITIFTIGFIPVFWVFDVITIILSGMIGVSAIRSNYKYKVFGKSKMIFYSFLQFVFCIDVAIAILVFTKSKMQHGGK